MSDELIGGVVAWFDLVKIKGMALTEDGRAHCFDSRNLSEQLQETRVSESHIVALEMNWRNGTPLIRTVHAPTREEAAQWEPVLHEVYEDNAMRMALVKAERRRTGFMNSRR